MHAVEDLVERVMGTSPLPRTDNEVTLLLVGLRRQLPHLERILRDTKTAPELVTQARRIRAEPLPEGRMPLVILTIRLAEVAQALIDAIPASVVPRRAGVLCDQSAADPGLDAAERVTPRSARRGADVGAVPISLPRCGSRPAAQLISAAADPLEGCGPPP
ncbi:hypothetical protein [Streptomyces sp. NPDC088775]|uniref:hypothetical protein n=1 Tax=Streptomyces sp. NPDC088775 TaxID=3365896 RepID=UPI0037F9315B